MKVIRKILPIIMLLFLIFPIHIKAESGEKIDIVYFYSKKCLTCKENTGFINELMRDDALNVITYDTEEEPCQDTQLNYAKAYGVPSNEQLTIPVMYIGDRYLIMKGESERIVFRGLIDEYKNGKELVSPKIDLDQCTVNDTFATIMKNTSFWVIIAAGFIDGINPCAISMLLLFYSFLMFCNQKKKIIIASACFIMGTFTANFTYGFGLTLFYNLFAGNQVILNVLYGTAIAMCLCAIWINSIDIYNQITNNGEIKNQLPTSFKYKITELARKSITSRFIFIGTFVSGFLIGVIELACTGQIYYPTIAYMMGNSDSKAYYLILLILYNIMFILPLVVVSIGTCFIKDHEKLKSEIMKKNYLMKILANTFFIVMIFVLLNQVF